MHSVVVTLTDDQRLASVPFEMDEDAVREMVERFIQGEAQGSFVVDAGSVWHCIPTRSIKYISIEPTESDA